LLYKKPICSEGFMLASFKFANYIKLRCQNVNGTKHIQNGAIEEWYDSEISTNGRRLLSVIQDTPWCPEVGFELKIVQSGGYGVYSCLRITGDIKHQKKRPKYQELPASRLKLLGFQNKDEKIPSCSPGWILRDFDMGDWVKIKCYRRVALVIEMSESKKMTRSLGNKKQKFEGSLWMD
jgi:hypothetical protein